MTRLFKYGDNAWEDPGPEFSDEDVKKQLTTYFPELANAEIKTADLPDGRTEVAFIKKAGTKGSEDQVTPAWIAGRLAAVKPADLEAPALLARLQELERAGELTPAVLIDLQPELERSMAALDGHIDESRKVIARCCDLPATPASSAPAGF